MSRPDNRWKMSQYRSDFEISYTHIPVKPQIGAPNLENFYNERGGEACLAGLLLEPRYLKAKFADGRNLKYPVPDEDLIVSFAQSLKASGAICIDYVGEYWSILAGADFNFTYRTTPHEGLSSRGLKLTGTYDYTSSVGIAGISTVKLRYQAINSDGDELLNCQIAGLANPGGKGACSLAGVVEARHLIIRAMGTDDVKTGDIVRKAPVADIGSIAGIAELIASCAYCLSYQGESVNDIHLYV